MHHRQPSSPTSTIIRASAIILAIYVFFVLAYFFLSGDQLLLRESRGTLEMPVADAGTLELAQGTVVEQSFRAEIQRLMSVSVQFGTYYRSNSGRLTMELLLEEDVDPLMRGSFDLAAIGEGDVLTISAEEPLENVYNRPLLLRLTSDAEPGCGVSPLMCSTADKEDFSLLLNGEPTAGVLCFSAQGQDYIWTGLHYWQFVAVFALFLILLFLVVLFRVRKGKRSYILNALVAVNKYRFLIRQLVSRDFKSKYKRSVLGVLWSFLNPLLMMLVQYYVFSTIFKSNIPHFASYLIIGTVMFNFFSEACGMTLNSILGNAGLITKVYMPKYIYPLTRTISSLVNLAISLIPMILVSVFTGVQIKMSVFLSLFFFACLFVFSLGLGMVLATSMVFFRDTQFLWNVLNMMWMYATPIFYPESILPEGMKIILKLNPLYHFLKSARMCILDGLAPEPIVFFQCLMIALAMLIMGTIVFYRNQDKFVLYL